MSTLPFRPSATMTLGVEMDLQILDADSLDLTPGAPRIFSILGDEDPRIRPEIFQSMLEVDTGVCETPAQVPGRPALLPRPPAGDQARMDGVRLRRLPPLRPVRGLRHLSGRALPPPPGEEPVGRAADHDLRLHMHLGMRDGDHAVAMINLLLPYLPHFLGPFGQLSVLAG